MIKIKFHFFSCSVTDQQLKNVVAISVKTWNFLFVLIFEVKPIFSIHFVCVESKNSVWIRLIILIQETSTCVVISIAKFIGFLCNFFFFFFWFLLLFSSGLGLCNFFEFTETHNQKVTIYDTIHFFSKSENRLCMQTES
jgi:hypothetical protein